MYAESTNKLNNYISIDNNYLMTNKINAYCRSIDFAEQLGSKVRIYMILKVLKYKSMVKSPRRIWTSYGAHKQLAENNRQPHWFL